MRKARTRIVEAQLLVARVRPSLRLQISLYQTIVVRAQYQAEYLLSSPQLSGFQNRRWRKVYAHTGIRSGEKTTS